MRQLTITFCLTFLCSLIVSNITFSATAAAQAPVDIDDLLATMERLEFNVPMHIAGRDLVRRYLGELSREKCDQQALVDLGAALDKAGYRREAAAAHLGFSATCGGQGMSLEQDRARHDLQARRGRRENLASA